jgi:hypothetical protein
MAEEDLLSTPELVETAANDIAESVLPQETIDPPSAEGADPKPPGDSPAPVAKAPTAAPSAPPAAGGGQPAPPPVTELPAPDSLSGKIKEEWAALPQHVRDEFVKREQDFRNGMDQLRQPAELGEGLSQVLAPYLQTYRQYGVNPISHIENLTKYHAILMFGTPDQKMEILTGLASDAGISPQAFLAGVPQPSQDVNLLQRELASLRTQLTGVTGRISASDMAAMEQKIVEFGDDTEKHPHFWDVAPTMVQLYRENPRLPLETAYKMALAANPGVYDKLLDQRAEQKLLAKQAEASKRATAALKARGTRLQSGSPVRPASDSGEFDLDKALGDTLAEINARS